MGSGFVAGARHLVTGVRLCAHPQLRRYVILPIAAAGAVYLTLLGWALGMVPRLSQSLTAWLPNWLDWLHWLLWPLAIVVAALLLVYGFILLCNLVAAPFNGLLAERAEQVLGGSPPPPVAWAQVLRDLPRSVVNELRKLGYFLKWAVPLLLISLLPGVNLLAAPLWILLGSWMLALEYLDYPMANHQLDFTRVRQRARAHRRWALGFGSVTLLLFATPVVNLLAMPAAVLGATAFHASLQRPANDP